mmetsp:Transcript_41504/g.47908  ORF Transcript_41504/g.47908 Transcript_41504/m.47908 type:complete len:393 (+) Transcript_41504:184-1362(+)
MGSITSIEENREGPIRVWKRLLSPLVIVLVLILLGNICNAVQIRDIMPIGVARKNIVRPSDKRDNDVLPPGILRRKTKTGHKNDEARNTDDVWRSSFFTCEVSIDGPTGVASSKESSGPFVLTKIQTKPSTSPSRKRQRKRRMMEEQRLVIETSRKFCATWPDFLCKGSVSFGFLRCVKTQKKKKLWRSATTTKRPKKRMIPKSLKRSKFMEDGTTIVESSTLRARFIPFPITFLEFGEMVESSNDNYDNDDGLNNVLASWDIPLQGGALVLQADQQTRSKLQGFNYPRGKLTFTIQNTKQTHRTWEDTNEESPRYQIITRIVDYRPSLAGGGWSSSPHIEPTRRLRHAFYLSTQSVVHAYMTFLFHRTWRQKLTAALMIENNKYISVRKKR